MKYIKRENIWLTVMVISVVASIPIIALGGTSLIPIVIAAVLFGGTFTLIPYLGFRKIYRNFFNQQADQRLVESPADVGAHAATDGNLDEQDLRKTDLSFLQIPGQDMSHSNMEDCKIECTNLSQAELTGAEMKDIVAHKANLNHVEAEGAKAQSGLFKGAKMIRANFAKAFLPYAKLMNVKAKGTDFNHANLNRCNMMGIQAPSANFENSKIQSANMRNANFDGANFKQADLINADLRGANLDEADFSFADLRGTAINKVQINSTEFFGALYDKSTMLPFGNKEAFKRGMILAT